MQLNVNNLVRREFPAWNQRGRIKKVDESGNIVEGQYAYGGEVVRISPRFQKNGTNYRIRPERPSVFFSQFCVENGLLPTSLTPEEAESEAGLEILEPVWQAYKHYFPKLESPYAACDHLTEPSLKVGFSFNIMQILVESLGSVRATTTRPTMKPGVNGSAPNASALDIIRQRIAAMRSQTGTKQEPPAPGKKKG